jgi:hypothetical protein
MSKDGTVRISWGKVDYSEAKPQQWFYHDKPCELLFLGFAAKLNGDPIMPFRPIAYRIRVRGDGGGHTVWYDESTQDFPGLRYETYEHHPGIA